MVRSLLRHAGGLRIDHALGLWRLWWVPVEEEATEGTYVRYPADALLAVLAEESQAASAIVVAEDLGTVPEGIPETLREAGIASSAVLWFEREDDGDVKPASAYPDAALASVTTHDLPTARGFWRGTATRVRHDLDLFPDEAAAQAQYAVDERERATMLDRLRRDGLVGDEPDETELVLGMHVLVARSPARLFAVSLSDATGEVRQPNMPGTIHQYPSWRLPLADGSGRPLLLEDVVADPEVRRLAAAVRTARSTKITD
jgi:4-alpha-glucanotransferase